MGFSRIFSSCEKNPRRLFTRNPSLPPYHVRSIVSDSQYTSIADHHMCLFCTVNEKLSRGFPCLSPVHYGIGFPVTVNGKKQV